ncbi:MAG: hypothetical protein ACOYXM_16680 [Actinomycetota bacterium]
MAFAQPLHDLQRALAALRHVATEATGWSDQQRQRFDQQRIQPLEQAGDVLAVALRSADESIARAQGALRGDP